MISLPVPWRRARARTVTRGLRRSARGPAEYKQDQCHLQNRHCGFSRVLLDKVSISLSIGITQSECGYNAADGRGNRLRVWEGGSQAE